MECNKFENFLKENEGADYVVPDELKTHVKGCFECKKLFLLAGILNSQKGVLEKTPETILFNVRQKIYDRQKLREHSGWSTVFGRLLKPAIAFAVLAIAVAFYIHFKNSPIGVVGNLAERFNIPELKYINIGDVLYVGKNIHVDFQLKNHAKLQLDSNTLLQFRAKDKIALSRGRLYLAVGNMGMEIKTPNGVITVKNTKARIHTNIKKESGISITKTSCIVFNGTAKIHNSKGNVLAIPGQEIVLSENGTVEYKDTLTGQAIREQISKIDSPPKKRVFTAREQLCDCVYNIKFDPEGERLHGKEIKENKFPVRIFWENKIYLRGRNDLDEAFCLFNVGSGNTRHIRFKSENRIGYF